MDQFDMLEQETQKRKSKKGILLILLLLLIVIVGGVFVGLYMNGFFDTTPRSRLERDRQALAGQIEGLEANEVQSVLDQKVAEGMITISALGDVYAEYGGENTRIGVQNVEANRYSFTVDLVLDDTGETLYSSDLIDPGYHIEYIKLNKKLAAGDYPATVVLTTYALDETEDQIAVSNVEITLHVSDGKLFNQ